MEMGEGHSGADMAEAKVRIGESVPAWVTWDAGHAVDDLQGFFQHGACTANNRHFGWPYSVDLSTQLDISLPSNSRP